MSKKIVKIYPDYCSSGLWDENGASMCDGEINMTPITQVALKYWHWTWEKWDIDQSLTDAPPEHWLAGCYKDWYDDGVLVTQAIQEQNPELEIQYKADTPEELIEYFYGEI